MSNPEIHPRSLEGFRSFLRDQAPKDPFNVFEVVLRLTDEFERSHAQPVPQSILDAVQEDGSLCGDPSAQWVSWDGEELDASLDGIFTAAELRAIADHMEKHSTTYQKHQ